MQDTESNALAKLPLISVILIFLNGEAFIEETIESIFSQTHSNWELLLVDDGSRDSSTDIALRYAHTYPYKVRYLEHDGHKNKGMSATRNLGIRHAKAEYIAFIDADDLWLPEILTDQLNLMTINPTAAMVYGPIQWWWGWTGNPEDASYDYIENPGVPTDMVHQPPTLLLKMLQRQICISAMLIRKEAIEAVGGFEERFQTLYEDQAFCAKICINFPVYVASKWWYRYRQHDQSSCSVATKTRQERLVRQQFLKWLKEYLFSNPFLDNATRTILKRELYKQLIYASNPIFYALSRPVHLSIIIGRRILPAAVRDWLWVTRNQVIQAFRRRSNNDLRGEPTP